MLHDFLFRDDLKSSELAFTKSNDKSVLNQCYALEDLGDILQRALLQDLKSCVKR